MSRGHELWLLNRGRTALVPPPPGVHRVHADLSDPAAVAAAVAQVEQAGPIDAVVQWLGYTPDRVEADLKLFARAGQYVFISSASAYLKPPSPYLVRESTPLGNPFWQYSQYKIACEELLRAADTELPITVVRPSLTYGPSQVPVCVNSWEKPYTVVARMRAGKPVIIPGDGTSLWTLTHNSDFAVGLLGLLGNTGSFGRAVHITSDEVLTWNDIYALVAQAAGADLHAMHVPTDALVAADPELLGTLWGDKVHSAVFDNTLIKTLVPEFAARVPFARGIRDTLAWFDVDPARQVIDEQADALWDRVVSVYIRALREVSGLQPAVGAETGLTASAAPDARSHGAPTAGSDAEGTPDPASGSNSTASNSTGSGADGSRPEPVVTRGEG